MAAVENIQIHNTTAGLKTPKYYGVTQRFGEGECGRPGSLPESKHVLWVGISGDGSPGWGEGLIFHFIINRE